jgi:predicted amidohydrolase YtcJ
VTTLLRDVDVDGMRVDVRLDGQVVVAVGGLSREPGEEVVDGRRGALLPGLHDHHLHLLALAAAEESVDVRDGLDALQGKGSGGWLRAVGWSGEGNRYDLDAVVADRPVRVQHRSGALWVANSAGVRELRLAESDLPGVERDERGEPTGRLWRLDDWLGERLGKQAPDLPALAGRLAALGITGCTDATADLSDDTCRLLRASLPQRLLLLGDPAGRGPVKVVLPDHHLPTYDELLAQIRAARPRPVAVHCVTREALVLLLTVLEETGRLPGDRVEHASLVPRELTGTLPPVVTQPAFLHDRGDDYLRDVDPLDQPDLYRYGSLLRAGTPVVPSSDAPFGPLDPWAVLRSARDRRTRSGVAVNPSEAVPVAEALDGMLRPLENLRAPARRVRAGTDADLVLLHAPLAEVLRAPSAELVRQTWIGGVPH